MIHHRIPGRLLSASLIPLIFVVILFPCEFASSGKLHAEDEAVPGLNKSIRKGVEFLSKNGASSPDGFYGLSGYALIKAGEEPDSPEVLQIVEKIFGKFVGGNYFPKSHGIYEASVDLMALEAADPEKYKDGIISITKFIVSNQLQHGGWNYLHKPDDGGDTSITQYAVLALWAAARAGIKVNRKVWLGVAKFQLDTQREDGGFSYHPQRDPLPTMTMTIAGVANLYLARKYLYTDTAELATPEEMVHKEEDDSEKKEKDADKSETSEEEKEQLVARRELPLPIKELIKREILIPQFSIEKDEDERLEEEKKLEEERKKKEEEEKEKERKSTSKTKSSSGGRSVSVNNIDAAIKKGLAWITDKYTPTNGGAHLYYYHYSVERLAALGNIDKLNNQDWYIEGAKWIIEKQGPAGNWTGVDRNEGSTSFALLFLTRATSKLLNGGKGRGRAFGKGILAGGRGLPEDLSNIQEEKGEVKKETMTGPLNDLLSALEDPESLKLEAAQNTIVERYQIGNREELIGQIDRLTGLLKDPRPEVRRTVLWALGRTGDMRVVPKVIESLDDQNIDVIVEARNALCWISHRPNGFGLEVSPLDGKEDIESDEEKEKHIQEWRTKAKKNWKDWYLKVRPYAERDDLKDSVMPVKEKKKK